MEESGAQVIGQLQEYSLARSGDGEAGSGKDVLDAAFHSFRRAFDPRLGGFGGAPKFPRPSVLNFLLRYHARTHEEEALEMVLVTLREMAKGGMNDQLGGGFHRYSVDEHWFVPHFEKMLYDQAQLAVSYLEAFQITGDALYAQVARTIFDYVLRDLAHPEGGFYSAEDADSAADPAHPHEKGEGAFYIWTQAELVDALGAEAAAIFSSRYGVEERGNVHEDPHGEFGGRNILFQAHEAEETAVLEQARRTLLAIRSLRPRPHLDDKILTAWNGMMISAFAKGARILRIKPRSRAAIRSRRARRRRFPAAANYGEKRTRTLLRRYRDGDAAIEGFLDDYAFLALALIDMYETTFDPADLAWAERLAERAIELFEDREHGGFFSTEARQGGSGAAAQRRLRRRGAFRQFGHGSGAAAAGPHYWPRRFPRRARNARFRPLPRVSQRLPPPRRRCWWRRCSPPGRPMEIVLAGPRDAQMLAADPRPLPARRGGDARRAVARADARAWTASPPSTSAKTTPANFR